MTPGQARRTSALGGPRGASLIPCDRLEADPRGCAPILSAACPGTQSIGTTTWCSGFCCSSTTSRSSCSAWRPRWWAAGQHLRRRHVSKNLAANTPAAARGQWCPRRGAGGGAAIAAILGAPPRAQPCHHLAGLPVVVQAAVTESHAKQLHQQPLPLHQHGAGGSVNQGVTLACGSWYLLPPGWRRCARGWASIPCWASPPQRPAPLLCHSQAGGGGCATAVQFLCQVLLKQFVFRHCQVVKKVVFLPLRQPRPLGRGFLLLLPRRGQLQLHGLRPDHDDPAVGWRTSDLFLSQNRATSMTLSFLQAHATSVRGHGPPGSSGYVVAGRALHGGPRRRSTACSSCA